MNVGKVFLGALALSAVANGQRVNSKPDCQERLKEIQVRSLTDQASALNTLFMDKEKSVNAFLKSEKKPFSDESLRSCLKGILSACANMPSGSVDELREAIKTTLELLEQSNQLHSVDYIDDFKGKEAKLAKLRTNIEKMNKNALKNFEDQKMIDQIEELISRFPEGVIKETQLREKLDVLKENFKRAKEKFEL